MASKAKLSLGLFLFSLLVLCAVTSSLAYEFEADPQRELQQCRQLCQREQRFLLEQCQQDCEQRYRERQREEERGLNTRDPQQEYQQCQRRCQQRETSQQQQCQQQCQQRREEQEREQRRDEQDPQREYQQCQRRCQQQQPGQQQQCQQQCQRRREEQEREQQRDEQDPQREYQQCQRRCQQQQPGQQQQCQQQCQRRREEQEREQQRDEQDPQREYQQCQRRCQQKQPGQQQQCQQQCQRRREEQEEQQRDEQDPQREYQQCQRRCQQQQPGQQQQCQQQCQRRREEQEREQHRDEQDPQREYQQCQRRCQQQQPGQQQQCQQQCQRRREEQEREQQRDEQDPQREYQQCQRRCQQQQPGQQQQCQQQCQQRREEQEREQQRDEQDPQREYQQCQRRCQQQQPGQQQQCQQQCQRRREEQEREQHRDEQDPQREYQQCQRRCQQQQPGQQQQCQQQCQRRREEQEREQRGGSNPDPQRNNPYFFDEQSFRERYRTQEGSIRVLPRFTERSNLHRGIENYRLVIFEANPNTFVIPNHFDADAVLYVVRGRGTITLVRQENRESYNLRQGDVLRIPVGSLVYMINRDNNERLQIAKLFQSVSTPGQFREFFAAGGQEPESYYSSFSNDILEAAFNTPRDRLERLFGQQKQGVIIRASPEQIRELSRHASSSEGGRHLWPRGSGQSSHGPYNILDRRPTYSNNYGELHEVGNDNRQLQDLDLSVSYVNISQGGMFGPYYNSRATKVLVVVEGTGRFEMACPHLSRQSQTGYEREEEQEQEQEGGARYEKVTAQLSPRTAFIVPAGHPVAIVASQNQNLHIAAFSINAQNNERNFLAGSQSVINQIEETAMELGFGVPSREVKEILGKQRESYFLPGPSQRQQQREERGQHGILSILDFVGM